MPASGLHRKPAPRNRRLVRICIAAGVGGAAALALQIFDVTPASAATPASVRVASAVQAAPAKATTVLYQVRPHDTLSGIATSHHVVGGWQRLYTDNKAVIGPNPNLIRPGEKLAVHVGGIAHPLAKAPAEPAPAAKPKAAVKPADSGWTKPVGDAAIGTGYHVAGANWSSGYHTGVDFLVGTGTPVHSVAAGTVVSAGWDGAYGNDVIIKHADGKYTLYAHQSKLLVSAGQTVTEGRQIGLSGATGNVTGPHLHFEVRTTPYYGSDIDPVAYLRSHGVSI